MTSGSGSGAVDSPRRQKERMPCPNMKYMRIQLDTRGLLGHRAPDFNKKSMLPVRAVALKAERASLVCFWSRFVRYGFVGTNHK